MHAKVYVWIEGENFSPKDFQNKLDSAHLGTIAYRKELQEGLVKQTREHWKSPFYETTDHKDAIAKLHELITQLRSALLEVKNASTVVCAEIVCHYSGSNETHGGIYLPSETIALLSEVGASLDVDEYFDAMSNEKPTNE